MSAINNLNANIKAFGDTLTTFTFKMHTGGRHYSISGISLSGNSFLGDSSPAGTVIGNISVQTIGGTFSGTLSLTGTDRAKFQIVGNQLQLVAQTSPGVYDINIVATPTDQLIAYKAQNFAITGATLELSMVPTGSTTINSGTPANTVLATLQGVWSNGAAFTGSYVFVAPNFDDGGLYKIVLNADHSGTLQTATTITSTVDIDEVVSIEATQ